MSAILSRPQCVNGIFYNDIPGFIIDYPYDVLLPWINRLPCFKKRLACRFDVVETVLSLFLHLFYIIFTYIFWNGVLFLPSTPFFHRRGLNFFICRGRLFTVWLEYETTERHTCFNHLPPGQNGRQFADDVVRCIYVNEKIVFWLKFYWSLFLKVHLTITQHWFR